MLLSTGCERAVSSAVCPPLFDYSAADQRQAAEELVQLGKGSIIRERFMPDYASTRDAIRKCRGE